MVPVEPTARAWNAYVVPGVSPLMVIDRELVNKPTICQSSADLYYRLNVISIRTPALRERPEDIPVLARHFVSIYGPKAGRCVSGISGEAEAALLCHDWPGNVRELQNVMERAVMLGSSNWIAREDLPDFAEPSGLDFEAGVAAAKRSLVERAFTVAGGHHDTAAALLRLNRNYLYSLLKKYNLVGK